MTFRKTLSIAMAVAAISCLTITGNLAAATAPATAPIITYSASGTFGGVPISGADTLKLAGEPFTVSIKVSAATVPFKTSPGFAAYNKLKLTGTVHSGLIGSTPVNIASSEATIMQGINGTLDDIFTMEAPVKVVGISLTIKATIILPPGTLAKATLHPFSTITLVPANATVEYSDSSATTDLAIQTGSLSATIP
jgi:hypothetical protein